MKRWALLMAVVVSVGVSAEAGLAAKRHKSVIGRWRLFETIDENGNLAPAMIVNQIWRFEKNGKLVIRMFRKDFVTSYQRKGNIIYTNDHGKDKYYKITILANDGHTLKALSEKMPGQTLIFRRLKDLE